MYIFFRTYPKILAVWIESVNDINLTLKLWGYFKTRFFLRALAVIV